MPAFVVSVNGNKVCSIALSGENTRTINIIWVGDSQNAEDHLLCLHIGGPDGDDHLRWSVPQLEVGDEVTIKITESSVADPPDTRRDIEDLERDADFD